jgi:hypothetical protein
MGDVPYDFDWAGLQTQFDLAVAARKLAWDLRKIEPLGPSAIIIHLI